MPFWLASKRDGQQSDWIQRFDPRFWTVDFPRPTMASVVTTAPDALRVEAEFHQANALAGLIWESRDRFDHPLLRYDTDVDYARTTLRFRWRSGGVLPLDAVHGPTLTIEGRDSAGTPRSLPCWRSRGRGAARSGAGRGGGGAAGALCPRWRRDSLGGGGLSPAKNPLPRAGGEGLAAQPCGSAACALMRSCQ